MTTSPIAAADADRSDPAAPDRVVLDGSGLTVDQVARVARPADRPPAVEISAAAVDAMTRSVEFKRSLLERGIPVYGVTTGFGDSVGRQIAAYKADELQRNLVLYHLNGVGPPATDDVVRATMLIRANCLVRGPSAIRAEPVRTLLELLRHELLPVIPQRGSLGASGDLVPLCYLAAALIGEGDVVTGERRRPVRDAMRDVGLEPVRLEAKEGLALINGTSFTAAYATLALADAREIAFVSDLATALACEALRGNASHFHPFLHAAKPHPGQLTSAERIRWLLDGSRLATDYAAILTRNGTIEDAGYRTVERPVQDRYSVRCAPHVTGVLRDSLEWARRWVEVEINSSTDNPLFDVDHGEVHHGGNFYAGHLGLAMDSVKVAVASVADLLDRQLALVVDEKFNAGLPANLAAPRTAADSEAGLHHGFKGMQIACSAVTAEALKMAAPATVFSRSTEAHNQDKVSMGTIAARDAYTIVELTRQVAAIHLIALCQALDLRGAELMAPALRRVHSLIRAYVPFADRDRRMDGDVAAVAGLIADGALRRAAGLPDPLFPNPTMAPERSRNAAHA